MCSVFFTVIPSLFTRRSLNGTEASIQTHRQTQTAIHQLSIYSDSEWSLVVCLHWCMAIYSRTTPSAMAIGDLAHVNDVEQRNCLRSSICSMSVCQTTESFITRSRWWNTFKQYRDAAGFLRPNFIVMSLKGSTEINALISVHPIERETFDH